MTNVEMEMMDAVMTMRHSYSSKNRAQTTVTTSRRRGKSRHPTGLPCSVTMMMASQKTMMVDYSLTNQS